MRLNDFISAFEEFCPPSLAEEWDAVGLIAGRPDWTVDKVLLAVDPCQATVSEAIRGGYDLLLTHHPLYLRGTTHVSAMSAKGSWVTDLIEAGVGLYAAHTNADSWGTAQAMADLLGLTNTRPLVRNADNPDLGLGRIGTIEPVTLEEFAATVRDVLPAVPAGILVGGEADRRIETVAVSPGSGDSFLSRVCDLGADVYVTADLRHHPATDHLWGGGCALVCPTHFASEWPLLPKLAEKLRGFGLTADVSTIVTDAWGVRLT